MTAKRSAGGVHHALPKFDRTHHSDRRFDDGRRRSHGRECEVSQLERRVGGAMSPRSPWFRRPVCAPPGVSRRSIRPSHGDAGSKPRSRPEYQEVLEKSIADQASGGQGNNFDRARCMPTGMPHNMTFGPLEFVVTPDTTYILIGHAGSPHLHRRPRLAQGDRAELCGLFDRKMDRPGWPRRL